MVKHGFIQAKALDDPEGYDGGGTVNAIHEMVEELQEQLINDITRGILKKLEKLV